MVKNPAINYIYNFIKMIITIDTKIWVTPVKYAEKKGVSIQTVQNWMARGRVDFWIIFELNNLKLINLKGKDPFKK